MGSCASKDPAQPVDLPKAMPDAAAKSVGSKPEQPADAPAPTPPRPIVFAILRNGHEVIRAAMKDIKALLDKDDADGAAAHYLQFARWMDLHKRMEEGNGSSATPRGFFAILDDKFDSIVQKQGLRNDHLALDQLERAMEDACTHEVKDLAKMKGIWAELELENEKHLQKEEEIMMPRVKQLMQQGENMKAMMKTEILALVLEDDNEFEHFVRFANNTLNNHLDGMPRVRVFDHALWACVTPEQWAKCNVWIKETVSNEQYNILQNAINGVIA